jgi:hypothetical protein
MAVLGRPQGLFDLHNSDSCVGSMLSKDDLAEILDVAEEDLRHVPFKKYNNADAIDEREIQKIWYSGMIPNAPPSRVGGAAVSLDEMILIKLITLTYPNSTVEHQIPWGRKRVDLRITVNGASKLVEFHGPSHFASSNYNPNPERPSIRKEKIENHFGVECVIWPYWIQRCASNVRAIFDSDVRGLGVLWSTNVHFGTFVFDDSAQMIEEINNRFQADRDGSYGYFYGPNTENRNNHEHPIIEQIRNGKKLVNILLPAGYENPER